MDETIKRSLTEQAAAYMQRAFELLSEEKKIKPSRENSETITLLETAMMWNNKDRTIKGELKPYPTHVTDQNQQQQG